MVRALLDRYADAEGYVTPRALDGVARLAGLDARDAAALRAGARIRGEAVMTAEAAVAGGVAERETVRSEAAASVADDDLTDAEAHELVDVPEDEPLPLPQTTTGGDLGDLTAAVAAALTVLENDRFRRRPDTRLLSAEAEVGLAVLVRGGSDHVGEEPDDATLSGLPHDDLRIRARDCLVLHNQRLVHKMAPRYLEQGLDYDDLFQHGALGLMRAARKFDPSKGFKFSTYATWWIRQSISRAIADEGAVIRIPVHMHEQIRKVALAERTLAVRGLPAGVADVAVYCDMTMQKVEEARKLSRRTDSLDRVIGDGVTLGDLIGWTNPLPPVEKVVLDAMLLEQIMDVVATFSEREARILVRRLGLDGDETLTLDELGREFGVTRERIRQIEVKTLPLLKQRLRTAGLTTAYGYDEESDPEARDPVGRQASSGEVGARTRARGQNSGKRRAPDKLRPAALHDATREVPEQTAETAQTTAAERRGAETAAAETATDPATPGDIPAGALMAEPEEQAERRSQECPDDRRPLPQQRAGSVTADGPGTGNESAKRLTAAAEPAPRHSPATPAAIEASGPSATEPPTSARYTADWRKALRMPTEFGGGVAWLAEYALLAMGHVQLTVLLGPYPADAVVRAVRERGVLDRSVVKALEVLRNVCDAVKKAGLTPEDFFERPSAELRGVSPRTYLAERPLVHSEPRLAVRAALREFVAELSSRPAPELVPADAAPGGPTAQPYSGPDRVSTSVSNAPGEDAVASPHDLGTDALGQPGERADTRLGLPQQNTLPVAAGPPYVQTDSDWVQTATMPLSAGLQGEEQPQLPLVPDHPSTDDPQRRDIAATAQKPMSLVKAGRRPVPESAREEAERQSGPVATAAGRGPMPTRADTVRQLVQLQAKADRQLAQALTEAEEERARLCAEAEQHLADTHREHEAELTRARDEHRRQLAEERSAGDARVAAAQADAARRLDALEETLLHRTDRSLLRKEQHLRAQTEERIARLEDGHREAQQALADRAEHAEQRERAARTALAAAGERGTRAEQRAKEAEQVARTAEQRANDAEHRASTSEERAAVLYQRANEAQRRAEETAQWLRRYREEGEARIAGLEQRLRQAEILLAERDAALQAAQQQASAQVAAAEQLAAARIAQIEHDAWARITELQQQLAAETEAAADRSTLRNRWRRS
ncbi:sigma-70 family RNA polymerase sigma factor [Streptomyces sp. NPDC001668]|uniref:sigma-70 family RNA polymerase sigma factor n=1 Tax=Streptomyces sp. NPDC001668 TaxID=3364598 RepID=UPI0036BF445D